MEIKLDLKIFAIILLFLITNQIEIYILMMLFILIHELSHLICGICMGFSAKQMKIMPLGVSIYFKTLPKDYNKKVYKTNLLNIKKLIIAIAGPVSNFIIAIIAYFMKSEVITYINILIGTINLVPIYPLDGGRILKYILNLRLNRNKVEEIINNISNITTAVLTMVASISIYYYKNIAILFIIIYLWILVINENRKLKFRKKIFKAMDNIKSEIKVNVFENK